MAEVLAKQPRPSGPQAGDRHQRRRPRRAGHRRPDRQPAASSPSSSPEPIGRSTRSSRPPGATATRSTSSATPTPTAIRPDAWRSPPQDPGIDGLLVILTPQAMTDPTATAEELSALRQDRGQAGAGELDGRRRRSRPARQILDQAGIPTFAYPDTAARVFTAMWRSPTTSRRSTRPRPSPAATRTPIRPSSVAGAIDRRRPGRGAGPCSTEVESKQVLAAYGIPTVETRVATTEDEAVAAAAAIGFPVVLKLHSRDDHPQDRRRRRAAQPGRRRRRPPRLSGDRTNPCASAPAPGTSTGVTVQPMVKLDGYELIVGSSLDPQFGPVLLFGTGGQLVEVFRDRALGLPPLNTTLARRMMEQTRIYRRSRESAAASRWTSPALEQLLVRFSRPGRRAAEGSRRSTSTPCSPRPSGCWRSTPG